MDRSIVIPKVEFRPSFLSPEKDLEEILRKLFVKSNPYSEELKRLIVINTRDCLDNRNSQVYRKVLNEMTLSKMIEDGYILINPLIKRSEHEEIKTYLIITFDNFFRTSNDEFRECTIHIDIVCHPEYWDLGNFRIRPLKIAGYIDGILNETRLSGIGQLEFAGCTEFLLDETLSGYTLTYRAVHGSDDRIPGEE